MVMRVATTAVLTVTVKVQTRTISRSRGRGGGGGVGGGRRRRRRRRRRKEEEEEEEEEEEKEEEEEEEENEVLEVVEYWKDPQEYFFDCNIETEVADQTSYLTQSQQNDTGPASPTTDPVMPGVWLGSG